jgi:hypothetical protein
MSRRALWLCLSLLVCACGVEDAPEAAEDLGEDSNSADQATDQEMRDIQAQDQGDDVPAPVDMSDDIRPDDISPDIPVEVDVPVDMSADTTTQDLSVDVDVDAQDDASADIVLDADVDVEQDPDVEQGDAEIDAPDDIALDQVETDTVEDVLTDVEEDIEEEDVNGDIVEEDMMEDVDAEYEFPIEYDYPTDRFVSIGSGPCAIREQDNLRYCWGGSGTRVENRYIPYSSLSNYCPLTSNGELQCYQGDFSLEGPFISVGDPSHQEGWVCAVDEFHHATCIRIFDQLTRHYNGLYKKAIPVEYKGMCGITLDDGIMCETGQSVLEDEFVYNLLRDYPSDWRVRDLSLMGGVGACACALLEDNTIRCWGSNEFLMNYRCDDINEIYSNAQYSFISKIRPECAIEVNGQIRCVLPELQEQVAQLNQHAPFSQVLYDASCALKTNGEIVCIDQLPPVSETTGRKIVVEREDYCSLDEQGYATCRDLLTGNVWASTPNVRFSLIKLVYEGRAYGLDTEGRFYYWSKNPPYTSARLMALIPDDIRAKNVFPDVRNNICFHELDDTIQCFLFDESQPTILNDEMPDSEELFVSLDMIYQSACGILYDGSVRCWGDRESPNPSETEQYNFVSINVFDGGFCSSNAQGYQYCISDDQWIQLSDFPVDKLMSFSGGSWCGLLNGEVICDGLQGSSFYESIERTFQNYNFIDVSFSRYLFGAQVCGIREDVMAIVCRGPINWGW